MNYFVKSLFNCAVWLYCVQRKKFIKNEIVDQLESLADLTSLVVALLD